MTKSKVISIVAAMLVAAAIILVPAPKDSVVLPKTTKEFARTSAMIVPTDKKSGGSGVVLKSDKSGSYVLTNKHVCSVVQGGGTVKNNGLQVKIKQYKLYKKHDLCIIRVSEDLKVTTVLAQKEAIIYSPAFVSGHPALLPHVLSTGAFSDKTEVTIMVGTKKCNGKETGDDVFPCVFFGLKPVLKKFPSQLVTALIQPGSSGSGVFNDRGELSGLVFAGSQGLGYAYIVPFEFVNDFLANHNKTKWRAVNPKAAPKKFMSFKSIVVNSLWVDKWQH